MMAPLPFRTEVNAMRDGAGTPTQVTAKITVAVPPGGT